MLMRSILNFVHSLKSSSIEVYEWKEADIQKKRLSNSPDFSKLTTKHSVLKFSGWDLAHAVVKADYLDRRNLTMPGIGFLLQASDLINFSKSPIELKAGTSQALNDVSLSSLAGRVGQGLAILYGNHLGLKFSAHLKSHVDSLPISSPGAKHKGDAMADFLFADEYRTVLIESKGTFTLKDNDPSAIKSVLKKALNEQVDPWMSYLQPPPHNGYVIYSCLRENSWAPSALSIVDPVGGNGETAVVEFSSEQVIKENYGALLRSMGLPQAAERLMRPFNTAAEQGFETATVEIDFLVFEHNDREFAVVAEEYDRPPYTPWSLPRMGIDFSVLQAVSLAIQTHKLDLTESLIGRQIQLNTSEEAISIFPDGSFLGVVSTNKSRRVPVKL